MMGVSRIDINNLISDLNRGITREVVRLALEIHATVVPRTPVDTGWARANWTISVGTFPENPFGERIRGEGVRQAVADSNLVTSRILAYNLTLGDVYILNNVPYIGDLNEGTSRQAPAMFVEMAIDHGLAIYRQGGDIFGGAGLRNRGDR